eukprot:s864_g4.t1
MYDSEKAYVVVWAKAASRPESVLAAQGEPTSREVPPRGGSDEDLPTRPGRFDSGDGSSDEELELRKKGTGRNLPKLSPSIRANKLQLAEELLGEEDLSMAEAQVLVEKYRKRNRAAEAAVQASVERFHRGRKQQEPLLDDLKTLKKVIADKNRHLHLLEGLGIRQFIKHKASHWEDGNTRVSSRSSARTPPEWPPISKKSGDERRPSFTRSRDVDVCLDVSELSIGQQSASVIGAMLKWSGDYSVPRLRAKLATESAGTQNAEPEYAEVYRPDLGQSTILRRVSPEFHAAVLETGGFEAFARSSGFRDRGYLQKTNSKTSLKSNSMTFNPSFNQTRMSRADVSLSRTRSVPTLGSRQVLKEPASTQKFPPTWHVRSTPSLVEKSVTWSYTKSADDVKEKQLEAACRKLWVAVHGAEYDIRQLVRDEQKEGGPNQAMLGRLNKSMGNFPSIQKALKAGAKIDWHNPEWDGATLLIRAARTSSMELAVLCLAMSANIQEKDNMGRGVQHWAALCGAVKLTEYLLTAYPELDLSLPDSAGDSPLHLAAYNGHLGIVRLLLRQGVKETPNALGFSPAQLAESRRMWHVCRFLREYQSGEGVKDRLAHILRYLDKEDDAAAETPLRELALRPCELRRADLLLELADFDKQK